MNKLFYLATAPFEAACQINTLAASHPAAQLHGHSYTASIRLPHAAIGNSLEVEPVSFLRDQLHAIVAPLNYACLNDHLQVPTDENLARLIYSRADFPGIERVAIQSTCDTGADLDNQGDAHIWRRYRFEAAHQLPMVAVGHPCGRMHGHGFEVILHANQTLSNEDMGIDFEQLDRFWQPLQQQLDYACLNDITGLENPTSEVLACWIWQQLKPQCSELSWVTVYETHTSGCNFDGVHYRIWKEQRFESALCLTHLPANNQRSRLHGHSYMIRLHLKAALDEVMGWTVDYGDVKTLFAPVYQQLDHQRLDQLENLENAGNRALLLWIKAQMASSLPQLDRIDLYETPGNGAILCWGDEGPALPD